MKRNELHIEQKLISSLTKDDYRILSEIQAAHKGGRYPISIDALSHVLETLERIEQVLLSTNLFSELELRFIREIKSILHTKISQTNIFDSVGFFIMGDDQTDRLIKYSRIVLGNSTDINEES